LENVVPVRKTFCSICSAFCGFEAEVEGNRVIAMTPDQSHPMSRGFSCSKGRHYHHLLNAESRAIRCQRRNDGGWRTLAREEALDQIATSLRKLIDRHGPECVAVYCGNGVTFKALTMPSVHAFMKGLGSHQIYSSLTIDQPAKILSTGRHGIWAAGVHSFDSANVVMLLGNNVLVSGLQGGPGGVPGWRPSALKEARKRGLKLIVVDPRLTETAQQADLYLPIKPGTDAVLLSGMIHYILQHGLEDKAFCDRFTEGLEQLAAEVTAYDLATTSALTGLDEALIREATEMFIRQGRGTASSCTGPDMAPHGNLTEHLLCSLNTLCGRYNRAGDRISASLLTPDFPPMEAVVPREFMPHKLNPDANTKRSRVRGAHQLFGEMPTATLAEEILTPGDGQIRALIVIGGNPALSVPDQEQITGALQHLELCVCIDTRMSETAALSDYFLPASYGLEKVDMTVFNDIFWGSPFHQVSQPVVEPPGDAVDEYLYLADLADRLGVEMHFSGGPMDTANPPAPLELLELLFPPGSTRVSPREIAADPGGRIFDQYAKVEVVPAIEGMEACLRFMPDGVAEEFEQLRTSLNSGETADGYLLICRRNPHVYNSMCHEFPQAPRNNALWAHPEDIGDAALSDGQRIVVKSQHGEIEATLQQDPTLRRGVVAMTHGFGGRTGGVSVSPLLSTEDTTDRYTHIPRMSALPVTLHPMSD
jgi:anaerobic selenocysteine-containing dehydrogenase